MQMVNVDDMNYLESQAKADAGKMNLILSGMISLINDTDDKIDKLESQVWYQRMIKTVFGKNKATKKEIKENHEKLCAYSAEAIAELYKRECVDERIMLSLSNRIIEVYEDHIQLKGILGAFVSKISNKINEISMRQDMQTLQTEIDTGKFDTDPRIWTMCVVLSQLDGFSLNDDRSLENLKRGMINHGIINDENQTMSSFLRELLALPEEKVGLVHLELGTIEARNAIARAFINAIEDYYYLTDIEKSITDKEAVIVDALRQERIDPNVAALSLDGIYESFLRDKKIVADQLRDEEQLRQICASSDEIPEKVEQAQTEEEICAEENPRTDTEEDIIELTDENITSIMQIRAGETKQYRNKNIHLSAYVSCEGTIDIDHCVIFYNESEFGDEITLTSGAKFYIRNSLVICKGYDTSYFVNCKGANEIVFDNTTFIDCAYMIKVSSPVCFAMTKCVIKNCCDEFVYLYCGEDSVCDIIGNRIIQNGLNQFNRGKCCNGILSRLFNVSGDKSANVRISENYVKEENEFRIAGKDLDEIKEKQAAAKTPLGMLVDCSIETLKDICYNRLTYFQCEFGEVVNCTFEGIYAPLRAKTVKECRFEDCDEAVFAQETIDNCVFINCTNVIRHGKGIDISNCQFISCFDSIVNFSLYGGGATIEYCQFVNLKNNQTFEKVSSEFDGGYACLTFSRRKGENPNYLRKCIFNGVELGDSFLIGAANGFHKPEGIIAYVEDCDFRNCSTKKISGNLIRENVPYDKLFNKRETCQAIKVQNCRGLTKINKEGASSQEVEIRTVATTGNAIGAKYTVEMDASDVDAANSNVDEILDKIIQNSEQKSNYRPFAPYAFVRRRELINYKGHRGYLVWDCLVYNELTFEENETKFQVSLAVAYNDTKIERVFNEIVERYGEAEG